MLLKKALLYLFLSISIVMNAQKSDTGKVVKSDAEWKSQLTELQYQVTRQKLTERPFTGEYYLNKEDGIYYCVACGNPLFYSDTKYESGCGWPSFYKPVSKNSVIELADTTHGMNRIEIQCAQCNSHLGHVFPDGPKPTGLRYCINSAALNFGKEKDPKKTK